MQVVTGITEALLVGTWTGTTGLEGPAAGLEGAGAGLLLEGASTGATGLLLEAGAEGVATAGTEEEVTASTAWGVEV